MSRKKDFLFSLEQILIFKENKIEIGKEKSNIKHVLNWLIFFSTEKKKEIKISGNFSTKK